MSNDLNAARVAINEGRTTDAMALLERVLRSDPSNVEARIALGVACAQAGDLDRAIDVLAQATAMAPTNAAAQFNFGLANRKAGRLTAARTAFEKALEARPDYPSARRELTSLRTEIEIDSRETAPRVVEPAARPVQSTPTMPSRADESRSLEWGSDSIAPLWKRFVAVRIDAVVIRYLTLFLTAGAQGDMFLVARFVAPVLYETVTIGKWGSSAGKEAVSIQVDMMDGSDITFGGAFLRALVKWTLLTGQTLLAVALLPRVGIWALLVPSISEIWALTNRERRALHDVLTGTIVSQ